MELYHLVPMSIQKDMDYDLDRTKNIKSLCSLCHRAIHHGINVVKVDMIEKIISRLS